MFWFLTLSLLLFKSSPANVNRAKPSSIESRGKPERQIGLRCGTRYVLHSFFAEILFLETSVGSNYSINSVITALRRIFQFSSINTSYFTWLLYFHKVRVPISPICHVLGLESTLMRSFFLPCLSKLVTGRNLMV